MMILNRGTNLDYFLHIAGKTIKKHQDLYFRDFAQNNILKYA